MIYWECLTHGCGSTNFNNLTRHEWEECDIRKKNGQPEINTWHDEEKGGLNGDVSRKFYKDWDKLCVEKQQKNQVKNNWFRQYEANEDNIDKKRRRYSQ